MENIQRCRSIHECITKLMASKNVPQQVSGYDVIFDVATRWQKAKCAIPRRRCSSNWWQSQSNTMTQHSSEVLNHNLTFTHRPMNLIVKVIFMPRKRESLLFIGFGIVAILLSIYLIFLKDNFWKGSPSVIVVSLVQLVIGTTIYIRSPKWTASW